MTSRLLPFIAAVLLASCATTAPEPPPTPVPVEPEVTLDTTPIDALPLPTEPLDAIVDPSPFTPLAASELEALPVPADDLWARIRHGFVLSRIDDPYVTKWEEWYSTRPDYVARMIDRSRRYLYHIVLEVERRGMPLEIALLPMIESAFNPVALSTSRASGIWQFIPSTGKHFGLQQTFWFDSRRDIIAATDGALNYLQKLYAQFNDWHLALAAYNWGEGNVARAIARNQKAGRPTDYASLQMPDETRNYVPKLQAVKNIVSEPEKYGLELADVPDAPYFAVVKTSRRMDVKRAAELAEMPLDEFLRLNPHHNRPVIAGADEYTILLPIDRAEVFAAKLELSDQPLVSWQAHRVRKGETVPAIAAKFGMSVETLRAINGLGSRSRVADGHMLLVPSQRASVESEATLEKAVFTTVPQGRTFYYRVRRGDTLKTIAARYAVTPQEIRGWNGMAQSAVKVGQRLRIVSDLAPNAGKAKRATGKRVLATRAKASAKGKTRPANGSTTKVSTAKKKPAKAKPRR